MWWKKEIQSILRIDNNDMKMGRRITLVLFHKPCRKNKDKLINKWMTHVWKLQRPQVQDKEDTEEDVDAAGRERKIWLMWIKCVNRRRSSELKTGAAQKLKTLRTTNLLEHRLRWLKHEKRSIQMGMPWSIEEDDEGKNGKQQCDNMLLLQNLW